jgi:hypothetical protein
MASQFDLVLSYYKRSMLEYKVSGQVVFKQQAEGYEKWLKDYVNALNESIQRDGEFINRFAKNYENTNPELKKYSEEIANARIKGPELQDVYEGEQDMNAEPPIDESLYYTKAAAVGGILALGAVLSFF